MLFTYGNKKIGIYENGVFRKKVDRTKHFMRKYNAYGLDYSIVEQLPVETKVIIDEGVRTYETTIGTYQQKGIVDSFKHGKQVFLSLDEFKICEKLEK